MVFSPESGEREPPCTNGHAWNPPYQENDSSYSQYASNENRYSTETTNFTNSMPTQACHQVESDSNPL